MQNKLISKNYDDIKEIPSYHKVPLGNAENLQNQKFNKLTPIYRTDNKGKQTAWLCKCDCGNLKVVRASDLKRQNIVSCGCYNKEKISNDLTGQRFGKLVAIKPSGRKRRGYIEWECKCDCGNITYVASGDLKAGVVTSCGCKNAIIDITGQKFGKLTVLRLLDEKGPAGQAMWECQCECGKIIKARGTSLRYGEITSCGSHACNGLEKDMVGLTFGKLTVISKSNFKNSYSNHTYWNCKCECGNTCIVSGHNLRNGTTKSCGCLNSSGEMKIGQLLNENNISFEKQKIFDNCYLKDGGRLRFDFYINKSYLIEYDGKQHYNAVEHWGGEEQLKIQQQRDEYKNQWCKENNIPLIRIPYWYYNNLCLEDLLLETTQFRVV